MDTEGRRRSDNFEDRGAGGGRFGGGGAAPMLFFGLLRTIGVKGTLIVVAIVGGIYFFAPEGRLDPGCDPEPEARDLRRAVGRFVR